MLKKKKRYLGDHLEKRRNCFIIICQTLKSLRFYSSRKLTNQPATVMDAGRRHETLESETKGFIISSRDQAARTSQSDTDGLSGPLLQQEDPELRETIPFTMGNRPVPLPGMLWKEYHLYYTQL